ncbi:MAG: transposase [Segetibacter sp.]
MKKLKKRCWSCGSLSVIRWGKQASKQRFKCKQCRLFFTANDSLQRINNRFIWFQKWVLERQTYKTLQRDSGLSKDTLQRSFYYFLAKAPLTPIIYHDNIHLRVDATYFKKFCVVCYQDNIISYTQLFRFSDAERYEEIKEDLTTLLSLGLEIASITCDGHKATLKAIKKVMPEVVVQRWLVHIQRMCLLWVNSQSKLRCGQRITELDFDDLSHLNT